MSTPLTDDQLHILVIDDDPDMRELFVRMLLPEGHQVFAVDSAEEGLALLPYDTFQVAFLDHHLPGMEGLVFGEYLRANNAHMKIALVTGAPDPAITRGAHDHSISVIAKPFRSAQLFELIDQYKEEAAARRSEALTVDLGTGELRCAEFFPALPKVFEIPGVPSRIEERLVREAKRSLSHLRSVARYNERDRVVAFSALLTMQVLGLKIPKGSTGEPLTAEYDAVMRAHGCKPAFSGSELPADPR